MKKKIFGILFVLALVASLGLVTAAPAMAATIPPAAIAGVIAPATGVAPVTTITATQYTGVVTWSPTVSGTFAASTAYTAIIILTPTSGYTLTGVTANFFTVAGATGGVTNQANSGVVTAVFPATAAGLAVVSTAGILGVSAPVTGGTPVAAIADNGQYTGTVAWGGSPSTFAVSTSYTATITLIADAGYTFTGVAANFFTVAGATATNSSGSGVVTAVFPATVALSAINIAAIPGVTAPVTGGTPVAAIADNGQYTGTVAWGGSPSTFAVSTSYTATITLIADAGYTFTGVAANFFTVAGATATNSSGSGVVTAVFPATTTVTIGGANLAIAGVTAPVAGGTPVTAITTATQYTVAVTWTPAATTFAAGTVYTATIILTPKTGYTLTGVTANSFTVAGATATNSSGSGVVTAVFPITATTIPAAIAGVIAPVNGATPVTTGITGTGYTGTVVWGGSPSTFAAGTVYTATITLTPTAGYTLTGVTANYFTVTGATATNSATSGVVTAVFPATSLTVVSTPGILGVTAPLYGGTPVAAITTATQYTGVVTWSPTVSGTFAAGTVYTATIILSPATGYTLTGVTANFFTVAGATVTNLANSGVVTAIFPTTITGGTIVSTAAIAGVTAPVAGGTPVTTITTATQYTVAVTWSPTVTTTFAASTIYTATITLTPKTGYTLTGVAANFFTVAGATATNSAGSGVVTAVFPATLAIATPISLSAGWNLISLPLIPGNSSISAVLSGLSGAPVISVWGYNAATSTWSSYAPGAPSSLTAMADGNGYWIESPSSQTLTVTGVVGPTPPATPPTYSVVAGWNLVGFKSTDLTTSLSTYLAGTNPTTAYVFNSGTQSYNSVSVTSSTVYGVPGAGYWVAFPAAATIYPH